jgi:hypothetical protein
VRERKPRTRGSRREEKSISAGYAPSGKQQESMRFKIAIAAENEFAWENIGIKPPTPQVSSFLRYVISFAQHVHSSNPELFYQMLLPLIRFRVSDFYVIFEPHRDPDEVRASKAQYLMPDDVITAWWSTYNKGIAININTFRDWIDVRLKEASSHVQCVIYDEGKRLGLITAIDAVRQTVIESMQVKEAGIKAALGVYEKTMRGNQVGSFANVFPSELARYYESCPFAKATHDELAFIIEPAFIRMCAKCAAGKRDEFISDFRKITGIIGKMVRTMDCSGTGLFLMNPKNTGNEALMSEMKVFVNSTMFLWIPLSAEQIKNGPIDTSTTRPDDIDVLYNPDHALLLLHERLYTGQSDDTARIAVAALNALGRITPEIQAAFQTLMGK